MNTVAISVKNVTKTYPRYFTFWKKIGHIFSKNRRHQDAFKALDNISFSIQKGEKVAILGRNGAGKSTLLKHLLGTYRPTEGSVYVDGFLYPLMHIGAGFNGLLSGYENTKLYLLNLGCSGKILQKAMKSAFDFAELNEVLHQPFQTYSLGMKMRLQFGAATAIKPDILVVDEILGAGDPYFVQKSAKRIHDLTLHGTTLVLVSHNMLQVLEFCDRAIWLEKGKVIADGPSFELVNRYEAFLMNGFKDETSFLQDGREVYRWNGKKGITLKSFHPSNDQPQYGDNVTFKFILSVDKDDDFFCEYLLTFWNRNGQNITRIRFPIDSFKGKKGEERLLSVDIKELLFHGQDIAMSFSIYDKKTGSIYDVVTRFFSWVIQKHETSYVIPRLL